ncbi:hypothetical protein RJ53_07455 [Methanocalculus chunghsingensis]|uniref:Leucine-binding protein domain-containing protein n=1 Tax=Methanocalculus chunghsingensis TaxID=156457 RepID=A0A8J7WAW4_9EURY|nr:ABC transporter substrate-binding protein [Methanocalculus chunghsingensis]MBR1369337.1 hypothetical protein [Methanocalculus chunghsingensis]
MREVIFFIIAALVLFIVLSITGLPFGLDPGSPDDAVPVAGDHAVLVLLPLTGPDASIGEAQEYGIRKVPPMSNNSVTLFIEDTRGDDERALQILMEYLDTRDIHGIIVSGNEVRDALVPQSEALQIPMLAIHAPVRRDDQSPGRYQISFTPPIEEEIEYLLPFLKDYHDIAVIYPATEDGEENAAHIQNRIPIVRMIAYHPEDEDFSELIRPLQAMQPEIFIIYGDREVPAIVSAIRSRGANPVILVWEEGGIALREDNRDLAEGIFILVPKGGDLILSPDEEEGRILPESLVFEAYDATWTLTRRISGCGGDPSCVAGWFWKRSYTGALGNVTFNERREAGYSFEIRQIRLGEAETTRTIRAPPHLLTIRVESGSADDWFMADVQRGVDTALSIINQEHTSSFPLAAGSGIPTLFDAQVAVIFDQPGDDQVPIGKMKITPDGKTSIGDGASDPALEIGLDEEEYLNRCFDILDTNREEKAIRLIFPAEQEDMMNHIQEAAEGRGYMVSTIAIYHDTGNIGDAVASILTMPRDEPLFLSARTPDEGLLIMRDLYESGSLPETIITIGDAWKSDAFIRPSLAFSDGILAGAVYTREYVGSSIAIRDINSLLVRQSGRELNDLSARAFTGVMLIADAANRSGSTDAAAIRSALTARQMTVEYGALYKEGTIVVVMRNGVYRRYT